MKKGTNQETADGPHVKNRLTTDESVSETPIVQQPKDSSLCLACAVAMVACVTLEEVLANVKLCYEDDRGKQAWVSGSKWTIDKTEWWLCDAEAARYLASKNLSLGLHCNVPKKRLMGNEESFRVTVSMEDYAAILSVESRTIAQGSHAVVWCPEICAVLDPQYDHPQLLSGYYIQSWSPCTDIENEE